MKGRGSGRAALLAGVAGILAAALFVGYSAVPAYESSPLDGAAITELESKDDTLDGKLESDSNENMGQQLDRLMSQEDKKLKAVPNMMKGGSQSLFFNPNANVQLSERSHHTSCQYMDHQRLIYLDRQHPYCPPRTAMSQIRWRRCHGRYFENPTKCRSHGNLIGHGSRYYQTRCQWGQWSHTEYLDRHHIHCPHGRVLSQFHLTHGGCWWGRVRIRYRCRRADTSEPRIVWSNCQLLRHRNLQYLDRQNPTCGPDEVIQGFRLTAHHCGHNHMRFRVECVKIHTPWWRYGIDRKRKYRRKYRAHWKAYVKERAKYKGLRYKNSMSGRRIQRKYQYEYRSYRHYRKKYRAINWARRAVKYHRLWRRYRRYRTQQHLARHYHNAYKRYYNKYLAAQGKAPAPPKVTYPAGTFAGPQGEDKTKTSYWATMWTDPFHDKKPTKPKPVPAEPKPECGKDCNSNAKDIYSAADQGLDGLLPSDPDWGSFPKALVKDPKSKDAIIQRALNTEVFDPLNNADMDESMMDEGKELKKQTGCAVGDRDCLVKMGVWPGEKPKKAGKGTRMHDKTSTYQTFEEAKHHLGSLLPDDPDWGDYSKQLVADPETKAAKIKSGIETKVYDPLDNADIGIVGGGDSSRNAFRRALREHSGCDLGEKGCLTKWMSGVKKQLEAKK